MFQIKLSSAMRRVLMAREKIARRNPFFASILFNARLVESEKHQTIWTDGINVYFNPDYVKANDNFIEGDVLEVVMHAAMQHVGRRKHRDLERWNEAADYSIRPLVHQFFRQHPDLHADDGKYPDKAAEEIYELLEKKQTAALLRGRAPTERACLHPSSHRPIVPHFCGIQYRTVRLLSLVIIAYPIRVRGTDGVGN